jgi:hypothetical protein
LRTFTLDVGQISAGSLSFGDLIDLAEATGIEPEDMTALIGATGRGSKRLRLLVGFAWIVARRDEPSLTYQDVLAGQVTVVGSPDPKATKRPRAPRDESPL